MHTCDEVWKEEPVDDGTKSVNSHDWVTTFAAAFCKDTGRARLLSSRAEERM